MLGTGGRPTHAMLVEASKLWATEAELGLGSTDFYWFSQTKDPGHEACVSLCFLPAEDQVSSSSFCFLQWTKPGLEGRVADVTTDGFLKCVVPVGKKRVPLNLQQLGGHIILPWTNAKIVKDKQFAHSSARSKNNPNKIPEEVQRVVRMCRVAESRLQDPRGADTFLAGSDVCFICSFGDQRPEPEHDVDTCADAEEDSDNASNNDLGPLTACPICLLSSHNACARKLRECMQQQDRGLPCKAPPQRFPIVFGARDRPDCLGR